MKNLVWFRSDLRSIDNVALRNALETGETLACILLPVDQLLGYGHGERKINFLREACKNLGQELKKKGMQVFSTEVESFEHQEKHIIKLCREHNIENVFWNNEYPLDERRRDHRLSVDLEKQGIKVQRYDDSLILPPDDISTGKGDFYRVYTPFRKAWLATFARKRSRLVNKLDKVEHHSSVVQKLGNFIEAPLYNYQTRRDFPELDATSGLSADLSAGTLSPLRALNEALLSNHGEADGGSKEITAWISQLIWREFYYHLVARFDPVSMNQPFIESTKHLTWNSPGEALEKWKQGQTGIPIVDAGMRQLAETGWMHNRLRMITAMFLTKNLLIDWRHGERHFLEQLIDGDFALNNGGWQWSASTGTDAAPYFRVFNPFTQAERFDQEAKFIKRFVPELCELPAKTIHNETRLASYRPENYPEAIVNTGETRKRAIAAFKQLNQGN